MTMPGWYRTEMLDGSDYAMHRLTEADLKEQGYVRLDKVVEAIYNAAGFLYSPTDTLESALALIVSQREGANALVADANKRINENQAELDELREINLTPTSLIKETRDVLKSVGFTVPEGEHLLGTVNKALKHHAGRAKDATEKFDLMEKTLMDEREQRKVWEQSSNQWHDHFKDREAQLADVRKDFLSLEADYRSLESINKMQEGLINASNARIAELEKGIELANTSRNLYKDASSANYERARAAELKLIKRKMREGDVGYNFSFVTNDGRNINNPCAHCGEQIPIEHAAIYNVNEGYGLHFACESAWKEKNGRKQDG